MQGCVCCPVDDDDDDSSDNDEDDGGGDVVANDEMARQVCVATSAERSVVQYSISMVDTVHGWMEQLLSLASAAPASCYTMERGEPALRGHIDKTLPVYAVRSGPDGGLHARHDEPPLHVPASGGGCEGGGKGYHPREANDEPPYSHCTQSEPTAKQVPKGTNRRVQERCSVFHLAPVSARCKHTIGTRVSQIYSQMIEKVTEN